MSLQKIGGEQMKNQKGISLITIIIIVVIVIIGIIIISNRSQTTTKIEWGYMPSTEYYELRLATTTSKVYELRLEITGEIYESEKGTLSLASFNKLGKDVKKAKGKWFKKSNVNFKSLILDNETQEVVTLTDGKHVAIFILESGNNYVKYMFLDEKQLKNNKTINKLTDKNLLEGYEITIK